MLRRGCLALIGTAQEKEVVARVEVGNDQNSFSSVFQPISQYTGRGKLFSHEEKASRSY